MSWESRVTTVTSKLPSSGFYCMSWESRIYIDLALKSLGFMLWVLTVMNRADNSNSASWLKIEPLLRKLWPNEGSRLHVMSVESKQESSFELAFIACCKSQE